MVNNKKIVLFVNGMAAFDFDKELTLEESQLSVLDKMDSDMDNGIKINGQSYSHPNIEQRGTFVTMNLIKGLQQENQAIVTASCAYIASRLVDVNQIHITENENGVNVKFN